ncbi:MAG: hypothetical protein PCFJNLEI_03819 [Verrucomicrobiae bacterium]|nr:hypothetical protein [Verrucomicrobiae bacterium]
MDNQKIRELIEVYRPGLDDQDEQFAELIAALRNDPTLQRQLDERVARDLAVRNKLRAVAPPADLKARLLSEQKVSAFPFNLTRQPRWLQAVAAVILLGLAILWLRATRQDAFLEFRTEMAQLVATEFPLDTHTNNLAALQQIFSAKGWPASYVVPPALRKLHIEGGCLREWRGKKVALLCFETKTNGDVWLFVVDRQVTPDAPTTADPQVTQTGNITTASWTSGAYTYLLATENPTVPIHSYF